MSLDVPLTISDESQAATTPVIPPVITGLTGKNQMTGIYLQWRPVAYVTSYLIYREGLLLSTSSTPNYTDTQVVNGNPYTYSVAGTNALGTGGQSLPVVITAMVMFTSLCPNRTPTGAIINPSTIRFHYFLMTPITDAVDVFFYHVQSTTTHAIVGLYDTTNPATNLLPESISRLDSNVAYGPQNVDSFQMNGISVTATGKYVNTDVPNLCINIPNDLTTPAALLKTYIVEVVSYKNNSDPFSTEFGIYCKNVSDIPSMNITQLCYNAINFSRTIPSPYVIMYDFTATSPDDYTTYIYPTLFVFQNVKNVLESIIASTPNARGNRANDMLVHFSLQNLTGTILGQSSVDRWTVDPRRTPNFPYEQTIIFNTNYFANGYMTELSRFNGSATVNNGTNIALFNVLLHEMIHGLGIFYTTMYNKTRFNVGWNSFLVGTPAAPWYKGSMISSAVSCYRTYFKNKSLSVIPIEANYGPGTALSHWDNGSTPTAPVNQRYYNGIYHPSPKYELMTGFINKNDYVTGLTTGALKDYGYNINLVCPYIVAYPTMMNAVYQFEYNVKVEYVPDDNKIVHRLIIEKVPDEPVVPIGPIQMYSHVPVTLYPRYVMSNYIFYYK